MARLSIDSSDFDAAAFLAVVHADTSFEAMRAGYRNLKQVVVARKEALRELVKQNFDRYIDAKNTVKRKQGNFCLNFGQCSRAP